MFLIRTAFWLTIVVALIPVNAADLGEDRRPVTTLETLGAARALVSDLAGFCERNIQACDTGREVFAQLGLKAKTGLRYVATYIEDEQTTAQADAGTSDDIHTGTID